MHLVLKVQNDTSIEVDGRISDTITEHRKVCEVENRLIWGQFSDRFVNGVAERNRKRMKNQIDHAMNTYSFFLANNKGNRELYVGKMTNIYGLGEMSDKPDLTKYVPSYYNSHLSNHILFVDVATFFKIDNKYLDNITLESTGDKVLTVKNSSSIFLVNIDEELEKLLFELLSNPEGNFQYQVEQEVVLDDVTVDDQPKDKPSKTLGSGLNLYKRNSKISKKAIVSAKYLCEIEPSHKDFISKITGENYVEAHHLIPMEYQDNFIKSIDVEANIVSLCVGCHKKLHHARFEVIEPLVEKLYEDRVDRLINCGIGITRKELLEYYK
ncbi:restriction endonuclease [Bacillus cereus]|nr:restriction endonuclease [Bacillus cereus]